MLLLRSYLGTEFVLLFISCKEKSRGTNSSRGRSNDEKKKNLGPSDGLGF
jgi:hypothetical protein